MFKFINNLLPQVISSFFTSVKDTLHVSCTNLYVPFTRTSYSMNTIQHEKRNLRIVYESWYTSEITNYVFPHDWLIYPRVQLRKGFWNKLDYFRNVSSMRKHFKQNISAIFPHSSITEIHYLFPSPLITNSHFRMFSVQVTNSEISACSGHISVQVCCLYHV